MAMARMAMVSPTASPSVCITSLNHRHQVSNPYVRSPGLDCFSSARFGGGLRHSVIRKWICCSTGGLQVTGELPPKLQEIVRLFQKVKDPRAKYEQLLHYAHQLKPLAEQQQVPKNRVAGCVSHVYIACASGVEDGKVYFEGSSDALVTRGLAALLVDGLSGATVEEVLKVTPDFVHMLGLKQSLTPSRSNGFLNMLKLMQKHTLEVHMKGNTMPMTTGSAAAAAVPIASTNVEDYYQDAVHPQSVAGEIGTTRKAPEMKKSLIEKKLRQGLTPVQLEVQDVSYQHAGHAGAPKGSSETHFNVKVVSDQFQGRSLLKRHRLVYDLLQEELQNGVHALSLITKTSAEVALES